MSKPSSPRKRGSSTDLLAAYRATRYRIGLSRRAHIDLIIGRRSLTVERLLARRGVRSGAFITAWNPLSQRSSEPQNARAQRALERDVKRLGLRALQGAGIGADASWPPERSVFVPGLSRAAAQRLARKYRQRAFVYVRAGARAELIVLR